jgi:hypothetical protein
MKSGAIMRRPQALAGSIGLLLGLAVISAQEKPNFAGRWVLVTPADRAGQEQTVTHDATTLTTAHASTGHGHRAQYKLDGTENRNVLVSHGSDIVTLSKASWHGNQLTIASDTTYPDGRKLATKQVWSLDADGRLTVDFTESGMGGASPTTRKLVYTRR